MPANVVTSQTLYDGVRNCVMKFTFVSGGGDEPPTKKVDVTQLSPPAGPHLKVVRIHYDIEPAGLVRVMWDTPSGPADMLDLNGFDEKDYKRFGGLSTLNIPNATGSIIFATQGFTINYNYSIVLEMIKGV